jgi:hypothetical protein
MRSVGWIFSPKSATRDMSNFEHSKGEQTYEDCTFRVHADMYPIVAPLGLKAGIALFSPSNLFNTDGSLMDGVAGFAVHQKLPASVVTAELAAIRRSI